MSPSLGDWKTRLLAAPAAVSKFAPWVMWAAYAGKATLGASIILPPDVETGGTFQLAFVTSGTYRPTASSIATYNAYVTAAAKAAGLDVINGQQITWSAIVSTGTVDARDNAVQMAPVYNLNQELVTPDAGGLWDSFTHILQNPIDVTEKGDELFYEFVWTGTDQNGKALPYYAMGSPFLVGFGEASGQFTNWVSAGSYPGTFPLHLYALSSPIIAAVVPEPTSLVVLFSGTILTAVVYRLRKN
ncbi:hypothetical protein [Paludisphaera rhizosphaerae]|uniref:hypothetical protein n=1 Tax=Paludisphaera rhizosphaerae TaxID=2711216 RepID=UPI0013EAB5C4|nr:hypothetical protein [Paludisphaera rhizosphaerae]